MATAETCGDTGIISVVDSACEGEAMAALKERDESTAQVVLKERDWSSTASGFADLDALRTDTEPKVGTSNYISPYAQVCEDIDDDISRNTMVWKLC